MSDSPGFSGHDFQLCPRCGLRAELDEEASSDATIVLACGHCGNTGSADRVADEPVNWAHGAGTPYNIGGEECTGSIVMTVTQEPGGRLSVRLMGRPFEVLEALKPETAKVVEKIWDKTRTLSLD